MNTAFRMSVCFVFSRTSEDRHGHADQDTERLLLSVVYTLWLIWYKVVQYGKKKATQFLNFILAISPKR